MIVLDTHAWVWWAATASDISKNACRRIEASARVGLCSVSLWEVSMLVERGRLRLDRDCLEWIHQALRMPRLELLDLTPQVAVRSTRLGAQFHKDPADQIIVATAIEHRAPLVTRDERIARYGGVQTVW